LQSANANAPRILEALVTLGQAGATDMRFAMLGLTPHLQSAVMQSKSTLREVASEIVWRQKARCVRIDTATVAAAFKTASKFPELLTTTAQWDLPAEIVGGEIMPLLSEHSVPTTKVTDIHGEVTRPVEWPVRRLEHYSFAATLAQLNRAWAAAVAQWRLEECAVWLRDPDDVTVLGIVHNSPNIVELQCHPNLHSPWDDELCKHVLALTDNVLAALPLAAPSLQRLLIREAESVSASALNDLMDNHPSLRWLDLLGSYIDQPLVLLKALHAHPHVRFVNASCGFTSPSSLLAARNSLSELQITYVTCRVCLDTQAEPTCSHCYEVGNMDAARCPPTPRWPESAYGAASWASEPL
jgi:hypothetical protein